MATDVSFTYLGNLNLSIIEDRITTGFEVAGGPATVAKTWDNQQPLFHKEDAEEDGTIKETQITKTLTAYLALLLDFPIESRTAVRSMPDCNASIDSAKSCRTEGDLHTINEEWDNQKILQNQVYKALKTAIKDIGDVARERKRAAEVIAKDLKAQEEKKKAEQLKVQQETDKAAVASMTLAAQRRSFSFPWASAGHPAIEAHENLEAAAAKVFDKDDPFKNPFMAGIVVEDETLKKSLSQWSAKFTKELKEGSAASSGAIKMQAPMTEPMGKTVARKMVAQMLPHAHTAKTLVPSVKSNCNDVFFFGFTGNSVAHDTEPSCLGTIRVFVEGTASLLIMCPVELSQKFADAVRICPMDIPPKNNIAPTAAEMTSWLQNLDKVDVSKEKLEELLKVGIHMHHATLKAPAALVTPPGYIVSMSSPRPAEHLIGIRCSFLPVSVSTVARLSFWSKALPEGDLTTLLVGTVTGLESDLRST